MRPDPVRDAGLRELRVNERLLAIDTGPSGQLRSYEDRVRMFDAYKAELKKQKRAVALECHPDRTAADPEETRERKTERFKRVTRAVDYVMQLQPRRARQSAPVPPLGRARGQGVVIIMGGGPFAYTPTSGGPMSSTNTTTVTGTGFFRW